MLRCGGARPGRRQARLRYLAGVERVEVAHVVEVALRDDTVGDARISSRITVPPMAPGVVAQVQVHGAARAAVVTSATVAPGPDGGLVTLGDAVVPARLEAVLGSPPDGGPVRADASPVPVPVWQWLVLPASPALRVPGPVLVTLEGPDGRRRVVQSGPSRPAPDGSLRVPLWIDPELVGSASVFELRGDARAGSTGYLATVVNRGASAREVWIETALTPTPKRWLMDSFPVEPALTAELARTAIRVAPGETGRAGFQLDWAW
ncbi:MAG: hypothetical protein R2939_11450 [Kofleriaceae bacterium]